MSNSEVNPTLPPLQLAIAAEAPVLTEPAASRLGEDFTDPIVSPRSNVTDSSSSLWERAKGLVRRHKGKITLGAAAASVALTLALNPYEEVEDRVGEALPWVGAGIITTEAAFVAGGAMMASSVRKKIGNPLTIKDRLPDIAQQANESLLFKSGFWINTAGAVGSAAVITAAVLAKMPPESYGLLGIAGTDIVVTVGVRRAMLQGIKNNTEQSVLETSE